MIPEPVSVSDDGVPSKEYYPMHLVPYKVLMGLEVLLPHQDMHDKGLLRTWTNDMLGHVAFVSHEWLGYLHPDRKSQQLKVLQLVLGRLESGTVDVESHWKYRLIHGKSDTLKGKQWQAALPESFYWVDFACVPQPCVGGGGEASECLSELGERRMSRECTDHRFLDCESASLLRLAVDSIPSYIERSTMVIVLAPICQHEDDMSRVSSFASWRSRGWCRMELFASHFARARIPLVVIEDAWDAPYLLFTAGAGLLPPGEGGLSCCAQGHVCNGRPIPCDRPRLLDMADRILSRGISHWREAGDYQRPRAVACLRQRLLRGLLPEKAPTAEPPEEVALATFRHRLDWGPEDDSAASSGYSWTLLHWACLAGEVAVVRALLRRSTDDIDLPAPTSVRDLNLPRGMLPMHLAGRSSDGTAAALLTLLAWRASPDVWTDSRRLSLHLLHIVASYGTAAQLSGVLQAAPQLDVDVRDPLWRGSPLSHLLLLGCGREAESVRVLLEHHAEVRLGSPMVAEDAALMMACVRDDSDPDSVRLLLSAGCNANARWRTTGKYLFAHRAARLWRVVCRLTGRRVSSLMLIATGHHMCTPLHLAASRGDAGVIRALLEAHADINLRNAFGETPLQCAPSGVDKAPAPPISALMRAWA